MDLGNYSTSLPVEDLKASKDFYEKLGFKQIEGAMSENWVVMKNGDTVIGLFQDMFPRITLTFNPGWNADGSDRDPFTDVRQIKQLLQLQGIEIVEEGMTENPEGPAYIVIHDPDGNPILIDQHR